MALAFERENMYTEKSQEHLDTAQAQAAAELLGVVEQQILSPLAHFAKEWLPKAVDSIEKQEFLSLLHASRAELRLLEQKAGLLVLHKEETELSSFLQQAAAVRCV